MPIRILSASLLAGIICLSSGTAQAAQNFEAAFRQAIADKALDRREYEQLYLFAEQAQDPEDLHLARGVLELLGRYESLIQLKFRYTYRRRQEQVSFLFSPSFAEDEALTGSKANELLGKVAQQDLLEETKADGYRCGAAAVLAGHYMLYGNFNRAFQKLGIRSRGLTYRSLHLAQEKLYDAANSDGEDGLSQRLRYQVMPDGKVQIVENVGEVVDAARKVGLHVVPLKISIHEELLDRQRVIQNLWRSQPRIPLLVGVYLDPASGKVYPPRDQGSQNHFVLVFNQGRQSWMYNSGVPDNGLQAAIRPLDSDAMNAFVMQTKGAVNALYKYP